MLFSNLSQVRGCVLGLVVLLSTTAASSQCLLRGDSNSDGVVNLTDPILTAKAWVFGDSLACEAAADVDANSVLDASDVVLTLTLLFGNVSVSDVDVQTRMDSLLWSPPSCIRTPSSPVSPRESSLGCDVPPTCRMAALATTSPTVFVIDSSHTMRSTRAYAWSKDQIYCRLSGSGPETQFAVIDSSGPRPYFRSRFPGSGMATSDNENLPWLLRWMDSNQEGFEGGHSLGDGLSAAVDTLRTGPDEPPTGEIVYIGTGRVGLSFGALEAIQTLVDEQLVGNVVVHVLAASFASDSSRELLREIATRTGGRFAEVLPHLAFYRND